MFFRPKFCSHCGEKIERTDWRLWTSRRFCDLCATDHRITEFAPVAFGLLGLIALVVTAANFSGPETAKAAKEARIETQARSFASAPSAASSAPKAVEPTPAVKEQPARPPVTAPFTNTPTVAASVYMCGAETKKGTPCSRRVKSSVRCFQHTGMPAMVADAKLKIG